MKTFIEKLFSKINSIKGLDESQFLVEIGFDKLEASNDSEVDEIINIVSEIRVIRGENLNIKDETLHLVLSGDISPALKIVITQFEQVICKIAKLDAIELNNNEYEESIEKTMVGYKIIIPLAGLIDPEEELLRLQKELSDVENDIKIISLKLSNDQFVARAPAAVVDKEKAKVAEAENKKAMLEKSISKLQA